MHLGVRVVGGRIPHHRNVVAELRSKPHGCFEARMRDQSDSDELLDAVTLELKIEVRVRERARAPMLVNDYFTGKGYELLTKLAAPGSVLERLVSPRGALDRRQV